MKILRSFSHLLVSVSIATSIVSAHAVNRGNKTAPEVIIPHEQGPKVHAVPLPLKTIKANGGTILSNTSSVTPHTSKKDDKIESRASPLVATSLSSTVLIIARDDASAYSAKSGLNGYGIPFQVLLVPKTGAPLPVLSSSTAGNFGAIVILGEVSYDYGATGYASALTFAQWQQLYTYQVNFGVRMVRLDVFPSPDTGTTPLGGCCLNGIEQLFSFSDTQAFPTAGLKTGAAVSTRGLWHYPATITNATLATEFAQFAATDGFSTTSTAGVINNVNGRQQMVFFTGFATEWSATSNFMMHAWIHWSTRGLYAGYRRVNFGTQVDDMFLDTDMYQPAGTTFRIRSADLDAHKSWTDTINAKLPSGSKYFMEIGHNGNGNFQAATVIDTDGTICTTDSISYDAAAVVPLEFFKPLGTGTNLWPSTPVAYPYTTNCANLDPLLQWFSNPSNRDAFAHISHTFSHEVENNATYYDIFHELSWNNAWLTQVGFASAARFSPAGIIPPAITGLHNGDALRAWHDNGVTNVVGDNTRSPLLNKLNEHWPLITTVADNGYDGIQITPRWSTAIYYNCDSTDCTVAEWKATSAGQGDFYALLDLEKASSARRLFGLHHDPNMFHQANLRQTDATPITINGQTAKYSLLQAWVETVLQEMVRLVNWPIITLKHDDIGASFANRMARDACQPQLTYTVDPNAQTITGLTVNTNSNNCGTPVPVTVPGSVKDTQGFQTEQIGADPLTIWVSMRGSPVTFTLSSPVPL